MKMDSLPLSKFKATCLGVLERVQRTRRPLRVTKFGRPIADIVPAVIEDESRDWLGRYAATAEIMGDLVAPVDVTWEALKP